MGIFFWNKQGDSKAVIVTHGFRPRPLEITFSDVIASGARKIEKGDMIEIEPESQVSASSPETATRYLKKFKP